MTEADCFLDDLDRWARSFDPSQPGRFYGRLLEIAAGAVGATGADWVTASDAQQGEVTSKWPIDRDASVLPASAWQAVTRAPSLGVVNGAQDDAPVVVAPVNGPARDRPIGVLAFELGETVGTVPNATLRLVAAIAEAAERYEWARAAEASRRERQTIASVEAMSLRLHRRRVFRDVAREAVEEGRRLVGCDRLAIVTRASGRWRVGAASGVDRVHRRSDAAKAMRALAAATARGRESLDSTVRRDDTPPQVEEAIDAYLQATGAKSIVLTPCHDKAVDVGTGRSDGDAEVWLLADWFAGVPGDNAKALLASVARHVGVATQRTRKSVVGVGLLGRVAVAAAALIALAMAAVVLALTPATLWVSVDGELTAAERARVFAPVDGVVGRVLVEHGQRVEAGAPLVGLESVELRVQLEEVGEAIAVSEAEIATLRTAELRANLRSSEATDQPGDVAGRLSALEERLGYQRRRLALLNEQAERLTVVSPLAGVVQTWRPQQTLADRPVRRGQQLLEVADADAWTLRLESPDHRSGPLLEAWAEAQDRGDSVPTLRAKYVLRSDPAESRAATVVEVADATVPNERGEPVVRVIATPDENGVPSARGGLGVAAKIDCGQHALGYVWLHNAIEAIRRRWF